MVAPGNWEMEKGMPPSRPAHLLHDVPLPAAAVFEAPLTHNLAWMQRFAEGHGAKLAPHGKTTMAPALFRRQLEAGAWGITLATAVQTVTAHAHGVDRVLMANQLVGRPNMTLVADAIEAGLEYYCVVDGVDNVRDLGAFFADRELTLNVLIELGVDGGRCGCRNAAQVDALVAEIARQPALALVGIEGYEGMIAGGDEVAAVRAYGERLVETVCFALDNFDRNVEREQAERLNNRLARVYAASASRAGEVAQILQVMSPRPDLLEKYLFTLFYQMSIPAHSIR